MIESLLYLNESLVGWEKVEDFEWMKTIYYLKALIYNQLGNKFLRNEFSKKFNQTNKNLEENSKEKQCFTFLSNFEDFEKQIEIYSF